jgi:hypothetical protein
MYGKDKSRMPYEARKKDGSDAYEVINSDTKEVKATHEGPDAKTKAEHQVELLHDVEADPEWEN